MEKKLPFIDLSDENEMSYSEMLAHIMFDDLIPPENREAFFSETSKENEQDRKKTVKKLKKTNNKL